MDFKLIAGNLFIDCSDSEIIRAAYDSLHDENGPILFDKAEIIKEVRALLDKREKDNFFVSLIHIKRWELPRCYIGAKWYNYFVAYSQHRDSDTLTRSNFICMLAALGGKSETVKVVRERSDMVGWVEWIAIHESEKDKLIIADNILARLESYSFINEDHFSEMEHDEYLEAWNSYGNRDLKFALEKKFKLKDEQIEKLDKIDLLELYQSLFPSGEYYLNDNSGISLFVDLAVKECKKKDLIEFINVQF